MAGNKHFGKQLKKIREARGYSQEDLAELVGLEYQTISRIETGFYFTSYENLAKIADALNVKIKDLFDYDEKDLSREEIIKSLNEKMQQLSSEKLQILKKIIDAVI